MAVTVNFKDPNSGLNLNGSGLGFFGSNFGASVLVGAYQTTTFVTDGNGTTNIAQVNNITYLNSASGIVGSATSGIAVTAIPNYLSTLEINVVSDTAVKLQNSSVRIYDRSNINNAQSGVTCKVVEIAHPTIAQSNNGSGGTSWSTLAGSAVTLTLIASPGVSGFRPNGANTNSTNHSTYLAISASPDSVGSKTLFGLYYSTEYL